MARRIEIEIVGDSKSAERAFARTAQSARTFNQQISGSNTAGALEKETKATKDLTKANEALFKVRSRRAASLGPFRVAGVGLAAGLGLFAATQAVRELSAALETTGEAALTTGGRIKNMTAALLAGNFIGAIDALTRGAKTLEEMGRSTTAASTARIEALQAIASGTVSRPDFKRGDPTPEQIKQWEDYAAAVELAGTGNRKLAQEALAILGPLKQSTVGIQALEWWTDRLGKTVKTASGELVTFKGAADDLDRLRGPGGVAIEAAEVAARPGRPTLPPLSPSQRRELELIGAEDLARAKLLEDRLRQLNNQMEDFHGNQAQRLKILTNIRNTEAEIAGIYADQAAKRKADAEEAAAAAKAAREEAIATRMGWLDFGIEKAEATSGIKDDLKAFRAQEDYLKQRIRQEGEKLDLVRELWRIQQRIKNAGKGLEDPIAGIRQVSTKQLAGILSAGTGLSGAGRKRLGRNIAGASIQPVYVSMEIDGREVGRAATTAQTRTGKRTAGQTSGRRG